MEILKTGGVHSEDGTIMIMTGHQETYHALPKISKRALERSETVRIRYRLRMACQYEAEQLVFVDESACDRRTFLRKKAWALEGRQACRKTIFARGRRCGASPQQLRAFSLLRARLRRVKFGDEETEGSVVAKLYGEMMSISATPAAMLSITIAVASGHCTSIIS